MSEPIPIQTEDPWPKPDELIQEAVEFDYPVESLPESLRAAVIEVNSFTQAPLALTAASAITAVSLAVQQYVDVERGEKLKGPVSAYFLTVADSGERKSTVDGYFIAAIRDYVTEQRKSSKADLQDYRAELASWEAKRKGVTSKINQLAKSGKSSDQQSQTLVKMEGDKPVKPRVPSFFYSDATPEALAHNLHSEWPSGGVISSEAGIVFGSHGMGSDSVVRNLSMLNELWSGSELKVDRRTSESFVLKGARLTMGLMVQEAPLKEFFRKSGDVARGSGFLARFLISQPKSTQGYRPYIEAPRNTPALNRFSKRITEILNEPAPINDDGELEPRTVVMTPKAKALWVTLYNDIEAELKPTGELESIRDVASKAADNVARLACLFQSYEVGLSKPIQAQYIVSAGRLVHWHLIEAQRFLSEMQAPIEQLDAVNLDSWLISYADSEGVQRVSKRTIQQRVSPRRLRDSKNLVAAIDELVAANRVTVMVSGNQTSILINPRLLNTGLA